MRFRRGPGVRHRALVGRADVLREAPQRAGLVVVQAWLPRGAASVEDGDTIAIDAEAGTIDLLVDVEVLDRRRAAWQPRLNDYQAGALWRFAQNVGPEVKGAVTHPGAAAETHVFADI